MKLKVLTLTERNLELLALGLGPSLAYVERATADIGGVTTCLLRFGTGWYIVAAEPEDDKRFKPLGPYETPELAYVTMRLKS